MSTEITTRVTESTGEVTDRVAYPCSARLQKTFFGYKLVPAEETF